MHAGGIKAGRDHRQADLIAHGWVNDRAEDEINIRVGGFLDNGRCLVDLEQCQTFTAGHIEQDAVSTIDGDIQQFTGDSHLGCFGGAFLTGSMPNRHERGAAFGHDGADVREIQVDQAGYGNKFRNTLYTLAQNIIRNAESVFKGSALVNDLQQAVIGNDDERVGDLFEVLDAGFSGLTCGVNLRT